MKTYCLFFAMILGLVSIWGISYGDPPSPSTSASSAKTNDQQYGSNSPDGTQEKITKPSSTTQGTPQVHNDQKPEKVTGKSDQVKPGTIPSVTTAHPAVSPPENAAAAKPSNGEQVQIPAVRPLTVVAPLAPAAKSERHLGANAAVVGEPSKTFGQTKTNVANAGINGTGFNHKH